jgi:hypothetical protein
MSGACLIAAASAPAAVKADADAVCDGIDDQVEINAALAADDKRPVVLAGLFRTSGPVRFVHIGASPVLHDLVGWNQDQAQVVADHAGNALEIHSDQLPQEWRITVGNLLIRGGTAKPARGISIQNGGFLRLENALVRNAEVGVFGSFANTTTARHVTVADCAVGLHLTGAANRGSHFNAYERCSFRNNGVGVRLETRAQFNRFTGCTIDTANSSQLGVQVMPGAAETDATGFDGCWFEGPGVPFDLRGGRGLWARDCRFAVSWNVPLVAQAGFAATETRIERPLVEDRRSLLACPQGGGIL